MPRALVALSTPLALAALVGAGCVEEPPREDFEEEPAASGQDEFNYEDVNDAEAQVDDSLENLRDSASEADRPLE